MPNQSKAFILLQQKQQAASQNTSSEQLRELAATGNKAICERVAANSNTPIDILLKLGAKFPKQLLENPVFPLLLLENPNFVEEIPLDTLISLLKEKQVPDFILNTASKHYNKDILILVASNPNTCKNTLEQLANSTYEEVREAAKLHINLAGEIQLYFPYDYPVLNFYSNYFIVIKHYLLLQKNNLSNNEVKQIDVGYLLSRLQTFYMIISGVFISTEAPTLLA